MKKYELITPEGTRDLLYDESVARRTVEEKLREIFVSYGYSEIITPTLEFYDVFNSGARYFSQESMYKLTDSKGRLLVLRPDTTMPAARLAATRLRDERLPLKLFYNQNIYRVNPKDSGRDDEITQGGIEIIGGDVRKSDLEVLSVALDVIKAIDVADFRFEIGDSAFFKILSRELKLDEDKTEEIRYLIETKNYPELEKALDGFGHNDAVTAIKALPSLFGGAEVFAKAEKLFKGDAVKDSLTELRCVYDELCKLGIKDRINVDLGLVNKADYYTGILFKGYVEGFGMPILSGGRYDTLIGDFGSETPATGFAVNVNAAANVLLRNAKKPLLRKADVVVYAQSECFSDAVKHCKELIAKGMIVDNSVADSEQEAIDYAKAKGIGRIDIVSKGKTEVRTMML